jgi:hypothetical protein
MNTGNVEPRTSSTVISCAFICVYLRLSAAGVLALLAVGCADLVWHKPGTPQATLNQEFEQCGQDARLQAGRELLPTLTTPLMIGADPQRRPIVVQFHQRDADRLLLEQDLTRRCMRGRGYELKPAQRRDG